MRICWWIRAEPEVHVEEHVVVPDIGGWRRDRMPSLPEGPYFSLAPDWVGEVLSPSTERIDRSRKLGIYAEAEVEHVWLVNPVERTLEVLRLRDGAWTIVAVLTEEKGVRAEPFGEVALELGASWGDPAGERPVAG